MTLRPCRRALSSPPRLSIVCFHQIEGLPSHAEAWHRSRDSTRGRAFRPSENRRAGASGKKRPSLGMNL